MVLHSSLLSACHLQCEFPHLEGRVPRPTATPELAPPTQGIGGLGLGALRSLVGRGGGYLLCERPILIIAWQFLWNIHILVVGIEIAGRFVFSDNFNAESVVGVVQCLGNWLIGD